MHAIHYSFAAHPVEALREVLIHDVVAPDYPEDMDAWVGAHIGALESFRVLAYDETLLHDAIHMIGKSKRAAAVACSLIRGGFDTNIPNMNGDTPMHALCRVLQRDGELIHKAPIRKLMLLMHTHQADLARENNAGEAPLDLVAHQPGTVKLLREFCSYEAFEALQEQRVAKRKAYDHRVDNFTKTLTALIEANQPQQVYEHLSSGLEQRLVTLDMITHMREIALRGNRREGGTTSDGARPHTYYGVLEKLKLAEESLRATASAHQSKSR